ncbi:hypothetical protein IDVR_16650 [Intrasporangium sp. DVR]
MIFLAFGPMAFAPQRDGRPCVARHRCGTSVPEVTLGDVEVGVCRPHSSLLAWIVLGGLWSGEGDLLCGGAAVRSERGAERVLRA